MRSDTPKLLGGWCFVEDRMGVTCKNNSKKILYGPQIWWSCYTIKLFVFLLESRKKGTTYYLGKETQQKDVHWSLMPKLYMRNEQHDELGDLLYTPINYMKGILLHHWAVFTNCKERRGGPPWISKAKNLTLMLGPLELSRQVREHTIVGTHAHRTPIDS